MIKLKNLLLPALSIASAVALTLFSPQSTVETHAAFEAKHYDIKDGGTWDGTYYYDTNGDIVKNAFFCDGTYTYFLQHTGMPMKNRLTYHPDGVHVIYFDAEGHEVFSNFAHVLQSIAGDPVDDLCFFDVFGYMYVDVLTYDQAGEKLYYANPYGVMECKGWFQFSDNPGGVAAPLGIKGGSYAYASSDGVIDPTTFGKDPSYLSKDMVADMSGYDRYAIAFGNDPNYLNGTPTKEMMDAMVTKISIPVWDFESTKSMNKVTKTATLVVNKNLADYFVQALTAVYNDPSQPVIKAKEIYAYSYRANVNNPSVLSNHSYGAAIDINYTANPNGAPTKSYEDWAAMPEGSVKEAQTKAYTIYEGSPLQRILCEEYHLYWGGYYSRTKDTMHFEFF